MHFFRNKNRPRSSFELQVGNFHLLEVTVHLVTHRRNRENLNSRRSRSRSRKNDDDDDDNDDDNDEWDWYDTNREEINEEFLELLEASVLSRMFGNEIEDYHRRKNPANILPPRNDDIDRVGSKNKINTMYNKKKRKGAAIGGGGGSKTINNSKKNNKKNASAAYAAAIVDNDEEDVKPDKNIYFSFGELIQLAYKKIPIKDDRSSRTILFKSNTATKNNDDDDGDKEVVVGNKPSKETKTAATTTGSFHDRQKLSHRLLVWISKSGQATAASSSSNAASRLGEGIYRSEMIPISSLFRKPAELMTLSDDDDDDDDDDDE